MFARNTDALARAGERGAVLAVCLIILALLSLLGVAALNTTDTEMMISANERDHKEAFYYADGGTGVGSTLLEQAIELGEAVNASGVAVYDDIFFMRNRAWEGLAFSSANSSIGIYLNGMTGTYVRIGADPATELGGFSNAMSKSYGSNKPTFIKDYLIKSHRYGARNSASEIDVEWRHLTY